MWSLYYQEKVIRRIQKKKNELKFHRKSFVPEINK